MKRTHGDAETRLYRVWCHMKGRCNNSRDARYMYYGGRGIKVCSLWNDSYEEFKEWAVHNGYNDTLSIDRIDVNGNYEPGNCRWIEMEKQAKNKRTTIYVTYDGVTRTLADWAKYLNVKYSTLHKRIRYLGFTPEQTVSQAIRAAGR